MKDKVEISFLTSAKSGILSFIMVECDSVGLMYRSKKTKQVSDNERRLIVNFTGKLNCEEAYLIKRLEENPEIMSVENISTSSSNIKTITLSKEVASIESINIKKTVAESSVRLLNAHDKITEKSLRIAEERLVGVIGPVASILVNSASKKTKNIGDLFLLLSRELEGDKRIDFLSLVQGIDLKDQT